MKPDYVIPNGVCAVCGEKILYFGGWTHGDVRDHQARPVIGDDDE